MTSPSRIPPKKELYNGYTPDYLLAKIKALGYNSFEELKGVPREKLMGCELGLLRLSPDAFHWLRVHLYQNYGFDINPKMKPNKDMLTKHK